MHQVSRHWQNQCLQTVSIHQTLGNSDQQGDTQSMKQIPPSATSESTIPEIIYNKMTYNAHSIGTARNYVVNDRLATREKLNTYHCHLEQR